MNTSHVTRRWRPTLAVLATILAIAGIVAPNAMAAKGPPALPGDESPEVSGVLDAAAYGEFVAWYADAVALHDTLAYHALWQAAAYEQAQAAARRSVPRYPTGTRRGVGECTGFVIPDYIIQRESGGNPFIWNGSGSGAFGCAQTLITHYTGGSCSGLDPYTIQGQRDCVNILSGGGTNLGPWAQTR